MVLELKHSSSNCLCLFEQILDKKIKDISLDETDLQGLIPRLIEFLNEFCEVMEFSVRYCSNAPIFRTFQNVQIHSMAIHRYFGIWSCDATENTIAIDISIKVIDEIFYHA